MDLLIPCNEKDTFLGEKVVRARVLLLIKQLVGGVIASTKHSVERNGKECALLENEQVLACLTRTRSTIPEQWHDAVHSASKMRQPLVPYFQSHQTTLPLTKTSSCPG